ncbi:hypothetical protein BCV70DRAFT_198701 [Testicularia cyperi]|uniref:Thioredoxin domain-containing protein n=1 Tax=Testicularia cyperi TaxID=1882483 RepID=A0A317XVT5_9BASI|nr:hypothetical protein BCV70DRAFT_198701 [Testicularia cyperi]
MVYFSSGSPPWCPDCVDALPHVKAVFEDDDSLEAHLVLVGEKPEWKTPENRYRKEFGIACIPTITKVVDGKEVGRLEDSECKDTAKIAAFVKN